MILMIPFGAPDVLGGGHRNWRKQVCIGICKYQNVEERGHMSQITGNGTDSVAMVLYER